LTKFASDPWPKGEMNGLVEENKDLGIAGISVPRNLQSRSYIRNYVPADVLFIEESTICP